MKKDKIMRRSEYGLIAPIPEDGNDLVDKHFSDSHHIKSIYFDDDEEYMDSFNFTQNEHYDKITEKLNDPQESMTINQNLEHTYDQYVTEYSILQKCKYMLHTVQFHSGVRLDKSTRMALKKQPRQYENYEAMIASHHYFISTENKVRAAHNFRRTFFELNHDYMKQFLGTIKAKCDEDAQRRARLKGPRKKEHEDMIELRTMHRHLSINDNSMYVNQWCPIAKIAMTMWQNKLKSDVQSIQDRFAIPIAIQYFAGDKLPRKAYTVKFSFLTMNQESKFWTRHLDRDELSAYGEDIINIMQRARNSPGTFIYLEHEAARKTNNNIIQDVNAPTMFYYQGKRSKCFTYSLAGAIKYLLMVKEIFGVDGFLQNLYEIRQQDTNILFKVNTIMTQNGCFTCKQLKKKKRKRKNIDSCNSSIDILDEDFVRIKNRIYVCSLTTSMGDNLHTVSIVNDWIFDANFKKAFRFGRASLDQCCKHNSEYVKYKTCKQIWMYTPSVKIQHSTETKKQPT